MKHCHFLTLLSLALNATLLWSTPCRAALGGDAASIAIDRGTLQGEISSTDTPRYRIQEISNAAGMQVREYLDGAGVVFAVSWSGPALPDLRQLLGAYYAEYSEALRNLRPSGLHRSLTVGGATVKVELAGHMRAYSGRAYLPARLPADTRIGELR